ncbi:hypothetical protein LCGC14_1730590 [marine sediment metagenome]|uniref:Uncharacterized protein n=1 Tax=marine sediment metagenome TaxID=412755 RepID=A0A0F9HXH3_9ZZZZ
MKELVILLYVVLFCCAITASAIGTIKIKQMYEKCKKCDQHIAFLDNIIKKYEKLERMMK